MRMSWSFTGNKRRTGYLSTDKGSRATYEYELSPTLLQRNLMHLDLALGGFDLRFGTVSSSQQRLQFGGGIVLLREACELRRG